MKETLFSFYCRKFVRILGILMVGYLTLQGMFTICCIQSQTEFTFYIENNVLSQIAGIILFTLFVRLLCTKRVHAFLEKYGFRLTAAGLLILVGFLGYWVSQTQFWYVSDMEQIYHCAESALAGDYSFLEPGGYLHRCPHQNGLFLMIWFLLSFLSVGATFNTFYVLNIIFYAVTIISLFCYLRMVNQDKALTFMQTLMLLCFLPYAFFCLMMYGNIISFGWACVAMTLTLWYCQKSGTLKIAGAALCTALAVIAKQNQLIIFIGLVIVLLFELINTREKRGRLALGIAIYTFLVLLLLQVPNWAISQMTGMEVGPGNSKWSYIAMGLMNNPEAPGWYNTYNDEVFAANHYDSAATAAAARREAMELSPLVKSTINDGGKINLLFIYIYDIFTAIVWFGTLLYLVAEDRVGWDKLLFILLFIGGFVFYMAYEAKAQYVVYYFLLLIPYSLSGYLKLTEAGLPRFGRKTGKWNKLHTCILVTACLACFIGLSDSQWIQDCFKLHRDTEVYYDYIHQYNLNFQNFRF